MALSLLAPQTAFAIEKRQQEQREQQETAFHILYRRNSLRLKSC